MYTDSKILQAILESKGLSVYKVHLAMNKSGDVYRSFNNNHFTANFIHKLEKIVGEDLSMFINC